MPIPGDLLDLKYRYAVLYEKNTTGVLLRDLGDSWYILCTVDGITKKHVLPKSSWALKKVTMCYKNVTKI